MILNATPLPYDIQELVAISGTYRLLARLWLREVDVELLELLSSPEACQLFSSVGGQLPPDDQSAQEAIEQLAIEYCHLFIGPKNHLPPVQSVWQSGQFQSQAVGSMRDFFEVANYQFEGSNVPDHLGVQLDVMAQLCESAAAEQRDEHVDVLRQFYLRHLTWPSRLIDGVLQRDGSAFYRSVAEVTREFLQQEQAIWLAVE